MGKLMISLSDQSENLVRSEVQRVYHGRVGGLSIFFEQVLRDYFHGNGKSTKTTRTKTARTKLKPLDLLIRDPKTWPTFQCLLCSFSQLGTWDVGNNWSNSSCPRF